jgi:hypothetical protein
MGKNDWTSQGGFYGRAGIWYEYVGHKASFRGKNNTTKGKVLILLHARKHKPGMTAGEIHKWTGVDYNYICARLVYWCQWRYIIRSPSQVNGRPCWSYRIAKRGERFVTTILPSPMRARLVAEINDYTSRTVNK